MLSYPLKFLANLIIFFIECITILKFESIKLSLFSKNKILTIIFIRINMELVLLEMRLCLN